MHDESCIRSLCREFSLFLQQIAIRVVSKAWYLFRRKCPFVVRRTQRNSQWLRSRVQHAVLKMCHPRSVRKAVGSSIAFLGLSATEAVENPIQYFLCFLEKYFKKYVNGHYLRYPMVSPGTILKSCDSEQRCSCIRNGRNASPGPQGCGATKQSLDATSAFCSVDPIKVHVVCKPNNIYYTNLYHPFWPEMGFMNHPKYSNMVYLLLGLPWLLLVFQIIRPEILSQ